MQMQDKQQQQTGKHAHACTRVERARACVGALVCVFARTRVCVYARARLCDCVRQVLTDHDGRLLSSCHRIDP